MYYNSLIDPFKAIIGSILFVAISFSLGAQNNWELAKKKNGIEVYTKEAPGWPLKAYFARGMVKIPYEQAIAYMDQINLRKEWVEDCTESKYLNKSADSEFIVYFLIDAPWPTSDRDMVLKIVRDDNSEENAVFYRFQGMAHYIPDKEDCVRINKATGYWKVRKSGEEWVEISTEGKSTTGGDIPDWLANMFVVDNPYDSIQNLKEILEAKNASED